MPTTRSQHLYLVRYRREGQPTNQVRHYLQERAARRLIERLNGDGRPDLAPLAELILETRPLGGPVIEDHLDAAPAERERGTDRAPACGPLCSQWRGGRAVSGLVRSST